MTAQPQSFEFRPRVPLLLIVAIPLAAVAGSAAFVAADLAHGAGSTLWLALAVVCAVVMLAAVFALFRTFARGTIRLDVGPESLDVRPSNGTPAHVSWRDVTRVQQSGHALLFDLAESAASRRMVVQAPSGHFPSEPLVRAIGARLDESRGYSTSFCAVSGEATDVAMEHGACDNPLGCASSGSCAVQALRSGVGAAGE